MNWKSAAIFLLLCFTFLGIFNTSYQSQPQGSNHIAKFLDKPGILTGSVKENEHDSDARYQEILLSTHSFEKNNICYEVEGRVLLKIFGEGKLFKYGDIIQAEVLLQEPELPNNFGDFNYREYLARQKIFVSDNIDIDQISVIARGNLSGLTHSIHHLEDRIESNIDKLYSYPYNTLIKAITTGNRKGMPLEWEIIFQDAGIMHILAISGLHVGIIAAALFYIFRVITLFKKREKLNYLLTISFLIIYAAIAGFRPSVCRATIMFITMLMAVCINRPYHIYNSIYLSALLLLFYQPLFLFDAGFLLSFTVTFFIIFLYPIFIEYLKKLPLYLSRPLAVSLAAWLGMAPLSAYYFYKISFISILANLIVVPLISIILILGIISIVLSFIFLPWAGLLAMLTQLLIDFLISMAGIFSSLPVAYQYIAQPKIWQIIYYYIFIISLTFSAIYWLKMDLLKKKRLFWVIISSLIIFVIMPLLFSAKNLSVHFINVGQGDSILIQTPQRKNILIDGGGTPYSDFDVGKKIVIPYLRRQGIKKIDLLVLTHPDLDHMEGLIPVLSDLKVCNIIDSGISVKNETYYDFISLIERDDSISYHKAIAGDIIRFNKDLEMLVLNSLNIPAYGDENNFNNHSIVLKLIYKNTSYLFTGDIEEKAENNLLYWENTLKSDILKVAHHGSTTSSSAQFLEKVLPEVAVVSVGLNHYNQPHQDVVERLNGYCQKILRTDLNGTIMINSDGYKYYINTLR